MNYGTNPYTRIEKTHIANNGLWPRLTVTLKVALDQLLQQD